MAECTDKKIGELLHAFELGALPPDQEEWFAIHLLQCQHCHEELEFFRASATCLREDAAIRALIAQAATTQQPVIDTSEAVGRHRFRVRSLVAALSVCVIVVAGTISISQWPRSPVQPRLAVQTITLGGTRSSNDTIKLSESDSAEVRIVLEGIRLGMPYQLRVVSVHDNREVIRQTVIDSVGSCYLTIGFRLNNFRDEHYQVHVLDSSGTSRGSFHLSVTQ